MVALPEGIKLRAHAFRVEAAASRRVNLAPTLIRLSSLAVVLGGLGGMVPERRKDLARLGMKSILAGSLATFLTGTIAGLVGP